ncbi:DUF273 domain-containing protein [Variovorax sp. J22R133]|uniref:DUF273 domain-containing protein n=1 Tax=Variovorax brevis TaxID=3053503 RepID=UPI002574C945|nr:DUF273 domain-containing protein [Variovorax sp. J22R133]MDM0114322.1 DUF273 domain-containing protein [Variovorax sp. J22R133]
MPLCLSVFHRMDEDVLRNHAHYCRVHGYPHQSVESDGIFHPALRDAWKYSRMLRHLRALPEGDWLLCLDADCVVFWPVPVDAMLQAGEVLAVEGPVVGNFAQRVMTGMLVLRNTDANRRMLHDLVADASRVIALEADELDASSRLREAGALPCNAMVADTYVHISWRTTNWQDARIFVVNLAPLPVVGRGGVEAVDILHDLTLKNLLVRQVNRGLMHGERILQPPAYPPLSGDALSSYNAASRIAFVTLYTGHVATYARVAEHNVKRYCDRHGYAFHVYRSVPEALGPQVKGNWAKAWVLQQHLAQHDWVIWIDADMLFVNPAQRFDELLSGRDLLFAKDIGNWPVNSGLMAFRNTPSNAALLEELNRRIHEVPDKSSVYASMGDQYFVNALLREQGLDGVDNVLDFVSVNTPHYLRTPGTLLMHFLGLGEPYRSVYMADQDLASLRAG